MSRPKNTESSWLKNVVYEPKVFLNTTPDLSLEKSVCDLCSDEDSQDDKFIDIKATQDSNLKTFTIRRDEMEEKRESTDTNETIFSLELTSQWSTEDETVPGEEINETDITRMIKEADDDFKSVSTPIAIRDCGEPLKAQHLVLDFSPVTDVDNEYNSKKCADFWNFIDEHEELQHLKAIPEIDDYDNSDSFTSTTEHEDSPNISEDIELTPITKMALKWLEQENVMSDSLVVKYRKHSCQSVSKEYADYTQWGKTLAKKRYSRQVSKIRLPASTASMSSKRNLTSKSSKSIVTKSSTDKRDLAQMMADMHKFDLEHPKSMNLPENPPTIVDDKLLNNKSILPLIEQSNEGTCEKCVQ